MVGNGLVFENIRKHQLYYARRFGIIIFVFTSLPAFSQSQIPLETWRVHVSCNNIHTLDASNVRLYGASENGSEPSAVSGFFNPKAEEVVHNFTSADSPLLSNVAVDIEIDNKTGEGFFATDQASALFVPIQPEEICNFKL